MAEFVGSPQTEECAICVDTLAPALDESSPENPVCILANAANSRVCEHYFHRNCATPLRIKECPLCKKRFDKLIDMPSPAENADEWYHLADHDGHPQLSKREVLNALKATLPLDYSHLEEEVDKQWGQWDPDGSGEISLAEFKAPNGLLRYVMTHFQMHEPYLCQAGCGNQVCEGGGGIAMLVNSTGHRTCRHFFHMNCVSSRQSCPICGIEYEGTQMISNPSEDPVNFFRAIDFDGDGELSKEEVIDIVKATCHINWKSFQAEIEGNDSERWMQFDQNNDGRITADEFIGLGGLLDYVLSHYPITSNNPAIPALIPHNINSYNKYFDYWDKPENGGDGNGSLDRSEIRRAIIKTFRQWHFNAEGLDDTIEAFNAILDPNNDGKISRDEFLAPNGWGATIAATLEQQTPIV